MTVTITKLANDGMKGSVPVGFTVENKIVPAVPVVGQEYLFAHDQTRLLWTTKVTEILELEEGHIKFKTLNSTYLITY